MPLFSPRNVCYSQNSAQKIRRAVEQAGGAFEVGGLLLGHRRLFTCYVVDVTVPSLLAAPSETAFTLEGEVHRQAALALLRTYRHKPALLGVWHSHICGGGFSGQDRRANAQYAALLGGALSMIADGTGDHRSDAFRTYFIAAGGGERRLPSVIEAAGGGLPRYMTAKR